MSLSQSFSQKIGNVRPLNPCPSLDIDFANGGYVTDLGFANQASVGSANFNIGAFNGPSPIFTRATAATFRGSNGLIQYAPENLLLRSEEFNDAAWAKSGVLAFGSGSIANAIASPNGTVTADFICENTANTVHSLYQKYNQTYTAGGLYSFSVYVAKSSQTNSRAYAFLTLLLGSTAAGTINRYVVNIDLSSGQVTDSKVGSNISNSSCTVQEVGSFWRVSLTASCSTSGIENYLVVGCSNSSTPTYDTNNDVTYQGNDTSGIYIWGAQLERSSTARPYISTTTTARYGPRFEYDLSGNPLGLLMEEQSTNLVYPSSTLTTQTRTVTAAPHTLSFYGTGSVSLSGATTGTVIGSGANTRTVYTFTPTAGSLTLTVSGSVTSAQLEQKPFATSYIPTVGGSITRNADVVSSTIGSWYNTDEGTIVVKGDRTGFNIQDSLFEFTSGTTASLAHRGDGTDENFLVEDAATTVTIVETIPLNSPLYFAASYSDPATQVNATVNAEPVQGTTLASTITTPTTLNIGYSPEISTYFNGHIKAFRYYAKALPSRLESFTLTA